jgi:hypothetical protein
LRGEHVYFLVEDITGTPFPVYLKTITSWAAFRFVLADGFKGKKGSRRALKRLYLLKDNETGQSIDSGKAWDKAILPYKKVCMSLLC